MQCSLAMKEPDPKLDLPATASQVLAEMAELESVITNNKASSINQSRFCISLVTAAEVETDLERGLVAWVKEHVKGKAWFWQFCSFAS